MSGVEVTEISASDEARLRETIDDAWSASRNGIRPFAAQIVDTDGTVLARVINVVAQTNDPTAHAEVHAIRVAAMKIGRPDGLAGATLYASAEPCAMCAAAAHWAGLAKVIFGVGEERLRVLYGSTDILRPITMSCREVIASGGNVVSVVGPVLESEAAAPHVGFWTSASSEVSRSERMS
ncbi:deaminase [Microvirga lotononidis]|uniref:Cytosine/adenosine deaminase n=1 Tax=Microvirga lotononidis TaxID=864069 RepID=I4YSQ4_9HYPH|nr:deaminase [Microvirga lotononidis]EIM26996.1 cytosine/adenosine deaminase [Microvirga lotononidis]WQO28811.1 deaminase [Microvirga lotononidis]